MAPVSHCAGPDPEVTAADIMNTPVAQSLESKYLGRLQQLVAEGQAIPIRDVQVASGGNFLTRETHYKRRKQVGWPEFVEWRTKSLTVLDQVVPSWSIHRTTIARFEKLEATPSGVQFGVSFLKAVHDDLRDGFFERLTQEIETQIIVDHLTQAEFLSADDSPERAGYVMSAVLAGCHLERHLRQLSATLAPPEPTEAPSGAPLSMGMLIDALKRRAAINEVTAKQLRAWAAIRNSAAHGNFDEFSKEQVRVMIAGVKHFLQRGPITCS